MPASEAQKRAKAKYAKKKTKQLSMRFFPNDMDLWEHLDNQPNKAAYIKQLIRDDMEKQR